jgi:hypothetical protein
VLVETFFKLAVAGHDEFFIEIVAVNIDRRAVVDGVTHEYDSILQSHGERDVGFFEEVQYSFDHDVARRIHVCKWEMMYDRKSY